MASILFKWLCVVGMWGTLNSVKNAPLKNHPIYVSVTEIEHNAKEKTLEISCKIFTDDFEKTLRKNYNATLDLINTKDKATMNKLVNEYVQKHLQIAVEGKKLALQFLGYEHQDEAIYSYYQVNNISKINKIDITNSILYEYKKEQMEIIHVTVEGNRKSTRLNFPEDKCSFQF